jgi:hypothetical protein
MTTNQHKGTELNNVRETWEKNEREQVKTNAPPSTESLQRTIEEEATKYDEANKEERLLTGNRASLNDDQDSR